MSWGEWSAAIKKAPSLTLARIMRPIFCEKLRAKPFAAAVVRDFVARARGGA